MKYHLHAIDLDAIRTDGGTQVRERLNEEWISELMSLYEEGGGQAGHDIPPILVVIDPEGNHWLVDGFHRLEAMRRLGQGSACVDVRQGPTSTLDFAKMLAAQANKHGLQRTPGDKRRAIEMVLSTAEGKAWKQEQIAKHCGVSASYVREVLGKSTDRGSPHPSTHAGKRAAVAEAVKADPKASDREIAKRAGVDHKTVAKLRAEVPPRAPGPAPILPPEPTQPDEPAVTIRGPSTLIDWAMVENDLRQLHDIAWKHATGEAEKTRREFPPNHKQKANEAARVAFENVKADHIERVERVTAAFRALERTLGVTVDPDAVARADAADTRARFPNIATEMGLPACTHEHAVDSDPLAIGWPRETVCADCGVPVERRASHG
jgi:transposase